MELQEWIDKYNAKTDTPFERDHRYKLFFIPDKGFCEITCGISEDMVIAKQMCGDALFWRRVVEIIAQATGRRMCGTYCIRHIKPYIRLFGFTVEHTENTVLGKRYFCIDKDGKHGRCSPAWATKNGERAYYITWEA